MALDPLLTALVAWLLTYAIHSTVLLGAAWAFTIARPRTHALARETLWRTALLGAVVTASAQGLVGPPPFGGRLDVPVSAASSPSPLAAAPAFEAAEVSLEALPPEEGPVLVVDSSPAVEHVPSRGLDATLVIGAAWALVAILLLVRRGAAHRRLGRGLGGREPLCEGPLSERLARLVPGARLSVTDALETPVAFGVRRPEICLPRRALVDLSPAQQEAMLAHEAAHLLRRDPAWLLLGAVLESVFFFQPLNRLALSRLRETSEISCDAWAATRAGAVALAECLAEVAGWLVHGRSRLPVPAMAHGGTLLRRRIERLLDGEPAPALARTGLAARLLPLALVGLVAAFAPGVSTAAEPSPLAPTPPPASEPVPPGPAAALDLELRLLDADVRALSAAIEAADLPGLPADALERLRARRAALAERRDLLVRLLTALPAEEIDR